MAGAHAGAASGQVNVALPHGVGGEGTKQHVVRVHHCGARDNSSQQLRGEVVRLLQTTPVSNQAGKVSAARAATNHNPWHVSAVCRHPCERRANAQEGVGRLRGKAVEGHEPEAHGAKAIPLRVVHVCRVDHGLRRAHKVATAVKPEDQRLVAHLVRLPKHAVLKAVRAKGNDHGRRGASGVIGVVEGLARVCGGCGSHLVGKAHGGHGSFADLLQGARIGMQV